MSTNAQFLGGIKSIQRGTITLASVTTATATITAVVPGKTELRLLGFSSVNADSFNNSATRIDLTNATTVTATRQAANGTVNVNWELTEFY